MLYPISKQSLACIILLASLNSYAQTPPQSQNQNSDSTINVVATNYTPSHPESCSEKKEAPIADTAIAPIAKTTSPIIKASVVNAISDKTLKADTDSDGVIDSLDQCPNTPKGYKVDAKGCPSSVTLQIKFATGKSTLLPSSDNDVKVLNDFMVENPASTITIIGHTDSTGNKAKNKTLSEARAKALSSRLIQGGIAKERISALGKGVSEPIASNKNEAGRALNRRIEIKIK